MFEEQEAKSYTEETGVFANHHISGGDTGIQKRETIDYEIRATYASLRKSEKKVADYVPVSYTHLTLPTNSRV